MKTLGLMIFGIGVVAGLIFAFVVGNESEAFRKYFPVFIGVYVVGMLLFWIGKVRS